MSEWWKHIKEESRKTVINAKTGHDFVIRKLTSSELLEAAVSPLIADKKQEGFASEAQALAWLAAHGDKMKIAKLRAVIENGVVQPRITYASEDDLPEDGSIVHARWIGEEEDFLYYEILKFSGILDERERVALEEILKNANGSGNLTTFAGDTASSPVN